MPKIIEGLRETIANTGKEILLEEGYQKLTMREVAKRCSIALGTLYNYFSSKDELVAQIMFEDWVKLFSDNLMLENVASCIEGLEIIYGRISQFTLIYRSVWAEYGSTSALTPERHRLLVKQINTYVERLFERFKIDNQNNESVFLAEVVLSAAVRDDVEFEMIRSIIGKLLK